MYDLIEQKRSVRRLYHENLIGRGDITPEDADAVLARFRQRLEGVFQEAKDGALPEGEEYRKVPFYPAKLGRDQGTGISREVMERIAQAQITYPEDFQVHPKVLPQMERRAKAIMEGPIDWATGELLAFGSLLMEGRTVRLTGQDSRRGTFSQRFAAVVDRQTNWEYVPLKHLSDDQGQFYVYDSLLSEYGVMGYEYGYWWPPQALVCWEASSVTSPTGHRRSRTSTSAPATPSGPRSPAWCCCSHGYEGQGPDHSSAYRAMAQPVLRGCARGLPAVHPGIPLPSAPDPHVRELAPPGRHHDAQVDAAGKAAASMPDDFINGKWRRRSTTPRSRIRRRSGR